MESCRIQVIGLIEQDGEENRIELQTQGRFSEKNGSCLLTYQSRVIEGEDEGKTSVLVKRDGTVIITQSGAVNSRLEIKKGETRLCPYRTSFGEWMLFVRGVSVDNRLGEGGGSLRLCYTLDTEAGRLSRNETEITVIRR